LGGEKIMSYHLSSKSFTGFSQGPDEARCFSPCSSFFSIGARLVPLVLPASQVARLGLRWRKSVQDTEEPRGAVYDLFAHVTRCETVEGGFDLFSVPEFVDELWIG